MSYAKLIRRTLLVTAVVSALTISAPAAMAATATSQSTEISNNLALKTVVSGVQDSFLAAKLDAAEKTSAKVSGTVTTAKLTALHDEVIAKEKAFNQPVPHVASFKKNGAPKDSATTVKYILDIQKTVTTRVSAVNTAVTAWQTELAAEQARIKAAEEAAAKKKAEEEAAAQKAAADAAAAQAAAIAEANRVAAVRSATSTATRSATASGVAPATTATPAPAESSQARIQRIANALGFINIPVQVANGCGSIDGAEGCYVPGSKLIDVTPYGLSMSDCKIRVIIAHEWKHYQQDLNGQIQTDANGNITNRSWLEADANAFGYAHGC